MKKIFLLLWLALSLQVTAQQVNGYFYGAANATSGGANNYLVEMILKQNGTAVQGIINYYFKNTFRSFKVAGTYNHIARQLFLRNIPVTYFGSVIGREVDCPMDVQAQLRAAKAGSNLIGKFVAKGSYKNMCPDLSFDLRLNKEAGNHDSVLTALHQFKETNQLWTPSATDTALTATIVQRPVVNYVVATAYKQRENVIAREIEVESDSLLIDFYDNGEVDGDSISIFFNDRLLASSQKLSTRAVHLKIGLDTAREVNEMSMFADNLGAIPPNTALMLITDGKKRYEVRLSSSLDKNAAVRIRRKAPGL